MKRLTFIILLLISTRTFAASMVGVEVDGRAAGLAEATISTSQSAASLWGNPAGIANLERGSFFFATHKWIGGVTGNHIAATYRVSRVAVGVYARSAEIDDIELREYPTSVPAGTFGSRQADLGGGFGYRVSDRISAGASIRWRSDRISDNSISYTSFNVGGQYRYSPNLKVGAVISELGSDESKGGDAPIVRTGLQYHYEIPGGIGVNGVLEARRQFEKFTAGTGLEAVILHVLALRIGRQIGYDSQTWSYGIGLTWRELRFDYGMMNFENDLGTTSRISIQFTR